MDTKNKLYRPASIILLLVSVLCYLSPLPIKAAATASLYVGPDYLSKQVGSFFTSAVYVNTGGQAANAFEGRVNFPSDKLSITAVSTGGSVCTLFTAQPSYSNEGGLVSFSCGLPTPGYNGSGAQIIGISFKAINIGTANVAITNAQVLANDGKGTNILASTAGATYVITSPPPAPTAVPVVSSGSHPDQNTWYRNNDIEIAWTRTGTSGFSYVLDQSPLTVPAASVLTTKSEVRFEDKADGTWYFHVRSQGENGWSGTNHFRIQIDASAPEKLEIVTDPLGEAEKRPMISFNATDAVSGIDHYTLRIDSGEFITVASPFTPPTITSGEHTVTVRAYDKAGNMKENSLKIAIKKIAAPIIIKPVDKNIFKILESLQFEGTAESGTKVDVFLDGKKILSGLVVKDGRWSGTYNSYIRAGKHEIYAVAVRDGIGSEKSKVMTITTDPSAISLFGIIIPSWAFVTGSIVITGVLLALLLFIFLFLYRKIKKIKDKYIKKIQETKKVVSDDFRELEIDIDKNLDDFSVGRATEAERIILEKKIEHHLHDTEEDVEKKLDEDLEAINRPSEEKGSAKNIEKNNHPGR